MNEKLLMLLHFCRLKVDELSENLQKSAAADGIFNAFMFFLMVSRACLPQRRVYKNEKAFSNPFTRLFVV